MYVFKKMIDENEYIRLKEKNRKLKAKVWNDYRNYSDELRMLKHQNKSLQNSIKLEQNKNRELFQHFSNKISQLQEQIRQVSYDAPSFTSSYSLPQKKKKKDNFQWRFQELEEEGKALQLETEKTFKKCRESSSFNIWLRDIPPPTTSYQFNYAPIVISPPQPTKSVHGNFFINDEDDTSYSSKQNEIHTSPIYSSHNNHKTNKNSKKKENNSSDSSTVSVKQNIESDSLKESSSDDYDLPLSTPYKSDNNINFKNDQLKESNKQRSDQNQPENRVNISPTSSNNRFPPPSLQINQNQQLNNNNKPSQNETKNTKLPSPIHIKTHIDDESDTDSAEVIYQQNNQAMQPIINQQPKQQQQSEVQIVKPNVQNSTDAYAKYISQSNWDVDSDNEEIIFDIEEANDDKKKEQENGNKTKNNFLSGGIQSDTNPILDTSDQNHQKQEVNKSPQSTISTAAEKNTVKQATPPDSPTSKGSYDFEINIEDDNFNNNDQFW